MQNNSLSRVSKCLTQSQSQRRFSAPKVVAAVSSNGRPGDRNASIVMDSALKEVVETAPVVEEAKSTVAGGVGDFYGEDTATEDQVITPWTVSVAR